MQALYGNIVRSIGRVLNFKRSNVAPQQSWERIARFGYLAGRSMSIESIMSDDVIDAKRLARVMRCGGAGQGDRQVTVIIYKPRSQMLLLCGTLPETLAARIVFDSCRAADRRDAR
jgi:hypothetical protein